METVQNISLLPAPTACLPLTVSKGKHHRILGLWTFRLEWTLEIAECDILFAEEGTGNPPGTRLSQGHPAGLWQSEN